MNRNKKVIESMTLAASLVVMSTFTAFAGSTEENSVKVAESVALADKNGTAGIIDQLYRMESDAAEQQGMIFASLENTQIDIVAEGAKEADDAAVIAAAESTDALTQTEESAGEQNTADGTVEEQNTADGTEEEQNTENTENEAETAEEPAQENTEWVNRVMANVEEDMNIRTAPDETSELAGKFYRGDVAEVVSTEGGWTQITSGNVTGYVKNDYLVYGMDALQLANEVCSLYATVDADALRLRSEPSEEASVVKTAASGDKLKVDKEAAGAEGWVAVQTSSATAYVSEEYVEVALNLGTALTAEEAAEKEAKEAGITKKPAVAASTDEVTLLGALIQCEAGNGSYEGMLAVGAVVMNRVRSGGYPGSISGVVYQAGQFPPALSGSVANVAAGGVKSSCLQAAQEAIAGVDNTNGALSFRSAASGYGGTVIGANVFF